MSKHIREYSFGYGSDGTFDAPLIPRTKQLEKYMAETEKVFSKLPDWMKKIVVRFDWDIPDGKGDMQIIEGLLESYKMGRQSILDEQKAKQEELLRGFGK